MSLWYLQGTLRKNAAHCSGLYHQPRSDHIRSAACHKLSVSHLGTAEARTTTGILCSFHPGCSWTASVLPKGLDWLWKTVLLKRWPEIQCSLPKAWGKHKPKSVHCKNLSWPFFTAWNLCPCSRKWPWITVPRESRSVLTPSCSWRHSTARKGNTHLKIALPSTLSVVRTQHHRNTYFASSL